VHACLREQPQPRPRERKIARAATVGAPPHPVDAANELCVETDPGAEPEAPAVDAAEADPTPRSPGEPGGRLDGIARQAERPGEHARATAWNEPDRCFARDRVQDLVVGAVAGEHVDRLNAAVGVARERGRMARTVRQYGLGARRQGRLDGREPRLADAARERVDDHEARHMASVLSPARCRFRRG
jgi:hypothetical protein